MNQASYEAIRGTLDELVAGERLEAVVLDALHWGRNHPRDAVWKTVNSVFRARAKRAPLPPYKHQIADLARHNDDLMVPILELWAFEHNELEREARILLAEAGLHGRASETPDDLEPDDVMSAVLEDAQALQARVSACVPEDAELMAFRVRYIFEAEPEEPGSGDFEDAQEAPSDQPVDALPERRDSGAEQPPRGPKTRMVKTGPGADSGSMEGGSVVVLRSGHAGVFAEVLDTLRRLPAQDPQWQAVSEFMVAVEELAESKRREADAQAELANVIARRAKVAHELRAIREEYADEVAEIGIGVREACGEDVAEDDLNDVLAAIDGFRKKLAEYRQTVASHPVGAAAMKEHWTRLATLLDEVQTAKSTMDERLGAIEVDDEAAPSNQDSAEDEGDGVSDSVGETPTDLHDEVSEWEESEEEAGFQEEQSGAQDEPESDELLQGEWEAVVTAEPDLSSTDEDQGLMDSLSEALPGTEIATRAREDDQAESWNELTLSLLADDDGAAAYWIARSLEQSGREPLIPSSILGGYQGARWADVDPEICSSLRGLVEGTVPDGRGLAGALCVAASLWPTLAAPDAGMVGWLQSSGAAASEFGVQGVVEAVRHYADHCGIALMGADIEGAEGQEEAEQAIRQAASEAADMIESAAGQHSKYQRASAIWHALMVPSGEMSRLLGTVAADDRSKVALVRSGIEEWRDSENVHDVVRGVEGRLYAGKHPPAVIASAKVWLDRRIVEAIECASRWVDLVERASRVDKRGDWYFREVQEMRTKVESALPDAFGSLREALLDSASADRRTAGLCLMVALRALRQRLRLLSRESGEVSAARGPCSDLPAEWWTAGVGDVVSALARRLLFVPGVQLADDGQPVADSLADVAGLVAEAVAAEVSLQVAVDYLALERKDFRFAGRLVAAEREGDRAAGLRAELSREQEHALAELRHAVKDAEQVLEHGVLDGVIHDDRRAELGASVEGARELGAGDEHPESGADVGRQLEMLSEVRNQVEVARAAEAATLESAWATLRQKLEKRYGADETRPIVSFVEDGLHERQLVTVMQSMAELQQALEDRTAISSIRFDAASVTDTITTFLSLSESIKTAAAGPSGMRPVTEAVSQGREVAGLNFKRLNKPRREEVVKALEAWQTLKQQRGSIKTLATPLAIVLRFLGFNLQPRPGKGTALELVKHTGDWAHFNVSMTAGGSARPIPQYGSSSHGSYHVLCYWGRPGMDALCSRLEQLTGVQDGRALVLYLGHLNEPQRKELVGFVRERLQEPLVLDESLLIFMSSLFDAPLPSLLRCGMPYTTVNPYTPWVAGDVPPEMFFGRDDLAKEIESVEGSCLVFGGRQLGKSALLRHVQRRFDHPELNHYAMVESIQHIGEPETPAKEIWRRLHRLMKDVKLIEGPFSTPAKLQERIEKAMFAQPDSRVIVMFDEADKFLDDDSLSGFPAVSALRSLMQATQRRFKVVFAGLHQVQRFDLIPNQPLAHLGRSIKVTPLDPPDARDLILLPLGTVGYDVEPGAVLRILSYCNYHPGLIQMFCKKLLERLRTRRETRPPWTVDEKIVETVYFQDVRESIRESFDWTLALDTRYQAIAWSMIIDQIQDHDGYAKRYTPGNVLRLVKDWWAPGFRDVGQDEMRGLLYEMMNLGVLAQTIDDRGANSYRLRSPNLVRLLGTEDEISDRLLALQDRDPDDVIHKAQARHRWIEGHGWSPLTRAQEQTLARPEPGVVMITATEALGASKLAAMAESLRPADVSGDEVYIAEMPDSVTDGNSVKSWLGKQNTQHRKQKRLVLYRDLSHLNQREIEEVVMACAEFCETQASSGVRRGLRVVLLLSSSATWSWLQCETPSRITLEERADSVVWARPYAVPAVEEVLSNRDMISTPEAVLEVQEATGGWPALIDEVCGNADGNDCRPAARRMAEALSACDSEFCQEFFASIGLTACPEARSALALMPDVLPAREEDIADVLAGALELTAEGFVPVLQYLQRICALRNNDQGELEVDPVVAAALER